MRKKLEEKRVEEIENYKRIQKNLEIMKLDAERKHKLKMEALENQIRSELEAEKQNELRYQQQRKELAANTRKIQEEKERKFKEQIITWENSFVRQEALFMKILQSCNPEMSSIVDSYDKQFQEIKNFKDSHKGSLDGIKNVCIRLDALCQTLQKEIIEFEHMLKIRIAQQEAEKEIERESQRIALENQKHEIVVPKQIQLVQPQITPDQFEQVPQLFQASLNAEQARQFNEYTQLLAVKKAQTKRLDETPELQQIRFALKVAINNSINLLNEKNKTTLLEGFQKLHNLLSGQRISTAKGNVCISDHIEALDWCKLRIAEKLIVSLINKLNIYFSSNLILLIKGSL